MKKRKHVKQWWKGERKRRLERIHAIKMQGCKLCGIVPEDLRKLHFHHRDPATKLGNIARECRSWSWNRVAKEIAKCDVLCPVCHVRVHAELRKVASGPLGVGELETDNG